MLSLLRVLAMGSIVVCHILQTLDNNWAWFFNIGVQVFLALSGYLYGHKVIDKWIPWFVSRLKKLYVPYIIFVAFFLIFYVVSGLQDVSAKSSVVYIFGLQGVAGGGIKVFGHLWFMTAIAICYLITPILQSFSRYSTLCTIILLILCVLEYYIKPFRIGIFSWLFLYSIGYFFPRMNHYTRISVIVVTIAMLVYALLGITWSDIRNGAVESTIMHNSLGLLILFLFSIIGSKIKFDISCKPLLFLDALSYYVFIVHVPFVRPPHDVLSLTVWLPLNIVIAFGLIMITAYALKIISIKIIS